MESCACLQTHLTVAVSRKPDFLRCVAVCDPLHKIQVRAHECDLPLSTTGHRAAANQQTENVIHKLSCSYILL